MAITLNQTTPQRLSDGSTATVSTVPGPTPESGRTVLQTWRITVNSPGNAQSLNGELLRLPWNRAGFRYFQGLNVSAPMPDAGWDELPSMLANGELSATLTNVRTNPLDIVLGQ